MHGLPADFDPAPFIGEELAQVAFTTNTVQFRFYGEVMIQAEHAFVFRLMTGEVGQEQAIPVLSSNVMQILGHTIVSANAKPDGFLSLIFENGSALEFSDDSPYYESYSIRIGDREIHV